MFKCNKKVSKETSTCCCLLRYKTANNPLFGANKNAIKKTNPKIKLKNVKKALRIRNISDTKRKNSPLLRHRDSVEIDTGKLDKREMIDKMSKYVERVLKTKYGN